MPRPVTPSLTVDIIIQLTDRRDLPIVLIERKYPPYGWALPGGFVDIGETVEAAAIREAKEEASMDVALVSLLGCYSDPKRDDRGHTVSLVFIAEAQGEPKAADDAKNLDVYSISKLPEVLAFDHDKILQDYCEFRHSGVLRSVKHQ